jgi:hypothetical protein
MENENDPDYKEALALAFALLAPLAGAAISAYFGPKNTVGAVVWGASILGGLILIWNSDHYPFTKLLLTLAYLPVIGILSFVVGASLTCAWHHGCL